MLLLKRAIISRLAIISNLFRISHARNECFFAGLAIRFQRKYTPELNSAFHKLSQVSNLNPLSQMTNFSQPCDV